MESEKKWRPPEIIQNTRFDKNSSENVKKAGDVKAKTIKQDAEEKIRLLYEYGPLLPAGSGYKRTGVSYQALTPYQQKMVDNEVAEIRRQADEDIKAEHSVADDRSRRIIRWSEERKESLNSVAENLESQLSETSSPSGVKLAPVGTGLYVRNYEATKTKRKLPDTRYSVARFVDKLDQNVEEENLEDIEIDTEENVRGSVVNFLSQKNSNQR